MSFIGLKGPKTGAGCMLAAGCVFSVMSFEVPAANAATWSLQTLYSFSNAEPRAKLLAVSNRLAYGTTPGGGLNGGGTVFKLARDAGQWRVKVIYNFCAQVGCADGQQPLAPLIMDAAGNLYGTASSGGQATYKGVVFKLTPTTTGNLWSLQVLHNFCLTYSTCPDGRTPISGLTYKGQRTGAAYDGVSPLYGVTQNGGPQDRGVVFSVSYHPYDGQWRGSAIYRFCSLPNCADGAGPSGEVSLDSAGNLLGVTGAGGAAGAGLIYKLSPPASGKEWSFTSLYSFCALAGCADGAQPSGPLTLDNSGNVFGTTVLGGTEYAGAVFMLAQNGSETVLHSFCVQGGFCPDGYYPSGGVVLSSDGTLFGTTFLGGEFTHPGYGTAWRITNGTFRTLHRFCGQPCGEGYAPNGLTPIFRGFIGTTIRGGTADEGTVFELTRQ